MANIKSGKIKCRGAVRGSKIKHRLITYARHPPDQTRPGPLGLCLVLQLDPIADGRFRLHESHVRLDPVPELLLWCTAVDRIKIVGPLQQGSSLIQL